MEQQRVVVQDKITGFKAAFPSWQDNQRLSFLLSTAGSIFSLHSSSPVSLPSVNDSLDVGGLVSTVQKVTNFYYYCYLILVFILSIQIKKFSECLSVVENIRTATSTFKNLSLFAKVLAQIDSLSSGYLSKAEWQSFQALVHLLVLLFTYFPLLTIHR